MTFREQFSEFLEKIGCTAKELAEASGLSEAVISRYRNGGREPGIDSDSLKKLSDGIAKLSGGDAALSAQQVREAFLKTLKGSELDFDRLTENLNRLIDSTNLNTNRLARFLNYDTSFISRIRAGQRRPSDPEAFLDGVCRYVCAAGQEEKAAIAALMGKTTEALENPNAFYTAVRGWLCAEQTEKRQEIDRFLNKLDEFDLNDYIRSIRFDELKVPSLPFQLPTVKQYYGLEQMRTGELDFFKSTVLAHSGESVFMCSDMDVEDMAKDEDFGKKWMFAIAMCLKKGLHLDMIHTVDRPFEEMMLGLEGWIPVYMTGQVSPYYLKNFRSGVYQHLNYVSGAAALSGECLTGHHNDGRYVLTKKPEEIAYFRKKSEMLLKKALPLMEIYRREREADFRQFMEKSVSHSGKRHGILSVPPLYTASEALLKEILEHNGLSKQEKEAILSYAKERRERAECVLQENSIFDEMPCLTEEEFSAHPVSLPLAGLFREKSVLYSYGEYSRHLEETAEFARKHENYTVSFALLRGFRQIQISVLEGEYAIISKQNDPVTHFVIRQPNLRQAIETMVLPVAEQENCL